MARYTTVLPQTTVTTTATVAGPVGGQFTKFTGTTYTVTIGNPVLDSGGEQTFYNAASGTITLQSGGSGIFIGPSSSGSSTQAMTTGMVLQLRSDGTNWVTSVLGAGPLAATTGTFSGAVSGITTLGIGGTLTGVTSLTMNAGLSGATTIGASGAVTFTNGTDATNSTSGGTLTVTGGTAISAKLFVGGTIGVAGLASFSASTGTHTISSSTASSTTGTGALTVSGGVGVAGQLTAATVVETSSIAFKENVVPLTNALDAILQLAGVTYDRKDGRTKNEVGLIAEEVYKVAPNLVTLDEHGNPYGLYYTKITAYLIESIKSLKEEINVLKGKK